MSHGGRLHEFQFTCEQIEHFMICILLTRTLSLVVDIMDRASVVMDGGTGGGVQVNLSSAST